MIDRLRSAGLRLARSPGWQLAIGGTLLALAYPSRLSGAIGLAILGGALGVAIFSAWPHRPAWLRSPPEAAATALALFAVAMLGLSTFSDALFLTPDWRMGDWGPQHAALARGMDALPGWDLPVWNHAVSTGDAPFELYPKLTYLITGHLALLLGLEDDLPRALMIVAVLAHLATALGATLLAARVAPKPLAALAGTLLLVEGGAPGTGGTVGLFRFAVLHSAVSIACALVAALAILAALRRPRLAASAAIWLATAAACIAHPAGLLAVGALAVGLAAVALLAGDVPPRRALAAIGHLALGIALGAALWMPLAERILLYGQHFPVAMRTPARLLEDLLQTPFPQTAFSMFVYAGYLGILAGLWSRRAPIVFVSATALVLLVGLSDAAYLALDLAPGQGIARLGTERLGQIARPFLAAAGAYGLARCFAQVTAAWRAAPRSRQLAAAAIAGVLGGAALRAAPLVWQSASARAHGETQVFAADATGRARLSAWARARSAELGPDAWSRAVFETLTHEHFHLTAETGLPTFHMGPQPDLLLRERIEDVSEASLRRFNVRWAIAQERSPALGDPATEQIFGTYHVREIPGWDGKFARIERGTGTVRVTRLDDGAVEIDVDALFPVLVALGTGYYPRWRAQHATGAEEPVYALPSHPGALLHVVSAWVAPGRTTFTTDAPLPSDGSGRGLSILAALSALAVIAAWSRPRWRVRILRRLARARARVPAIAPLAARIGVPLALAALLVRGCRDERRPARALELGTGLRATATVEARAGGAAWETCEYERLTASYSCEGVAAVYDGTANLLTDAPPSWGFNTPAILASAQVPGVEIRVRARARLAGRYWIAVSAGTAQLDVSGEAPRELERAIVRYADTGARDLELRAAVPPGWWAFTLVEEDTIVPARAHLAAPPDAAPPEVRAIPLGSREPERRP